ncbi:hypothetical protein GE21DRAFT_5389 [Neurospora crassa]|uniref:Nucleoside-diphosphate-sugar epimerase n=1 Tax=Neurospora crassa (strain ATCC 24698 / 74-OR23-1A / CBS 708.71 / DSM 1257 / FGSC 987) TaxID=367110 RepID=Q7S3T4_NEUCR|nr:nucleoside-diphosphate-sugar epimerase [Neurospora crassa OR74A]EAA30145.1 nucleoside-diphosphate-sugar epimerase [Neurospora crassa OR74A]KHE81608.1 hypothetical protein GE21DRAFT_5389 [Neurospora crassa]|eukprot:XP_959381.1 nucleoside-diphosphate-sugar epimerase [Neurospora crassa OR74A]
MHLILTGATGLIGSAVLDAMIKTKDITKISIISRRPVKMAEDAKDPRINVILHKDFEKYDSELLNQLQGATGCVWALGISQNAVGKEEYVKITKDFPLAAAAAFQTLPPSSSSSPSPDQDKEPFRFIYVSGEGTTTTPPSSQSPLSRLTTPFFAIIKGQAELALSQLSTSTFLPFSMRPAFIDAAAHPAIHPYIPKVSGLYTLSNCVLGPPIRAGYKKMWSPTEHLGKFLVEMAMGKWDETIRKEAEVSNGKGFEKLEGGSVVVGNEGWRRIASLEG